MKIQCDVDEQVWRQARVVGLREGKSMGELVEAGLRWVLGSGVREVITGKKESQPKDREFEKAVEAAKDEAMHDEMLGSQERPKAYDPFKGKGKLDLSKVPTEDKRGKR